ncbi:class I SAM-dependent methyltransferase [Streptomyces sp. NPDC002851]
MGKYAPQLGTVQETLLITLYARAAETLDPEGMLQDPKSVEMTELIDYDFSKFEGKPSMFGVSFRSLLYDHWVRRFLAEHPDGTVVEIGCGLNTRFERVDNGRAHWVEFDLPDAVELRRRFFTDDADGRRTMLGVSVLDQEWRTAVAALPGPYLFVAEAVLPFLPEGEVRVLIGELTEAFPGALLITDTTAPAMVDSQDQHDVLSLMQARMVWKCSDPRQVEDWHPGVRLQESATFGDAPAAVVDALPPSRRASYDVLLREHGATLSAYRRNVFRLGGDGV